MLHFVAQAVAKLHMLLRDGGKRRIESVAVGEGDVGQICAKALKLVQDIVLQEVPNRAVGRDRELVYRVALLTSHVFELAAGAGVRRSGTFVDQLVRHLQHNVGQLHHLRNAAVNRPCQLGYAHAAVLAPVGQRCAGQHGVFTLQHRSRRLTQRLQLVCDVILQNIQQALFARRVSGHATGWHRLVALAVPSVKAAAASSAIALTNDHADNVRLALLAVPVRSALVRRCGRWI